MKSEPIRRAALRSHASISRHGAVRRACQRAGIAVPVAEHRGVCRGHHQCQQPQFEGAGERAAAAHFGKPCAAERAAIDPGHAGGICRRANRDQGVDRSADPAQGNGADHARPDRGHQPGRGRDQDPGAADQPAGFVSNHVDALPDHADQVSCRSDESLRIRRHAKRPPCGGLFGLAAGAMVMRICGRARSMSAAFGRFRESAPHGRSVSSIPSARDRDRRSGCGC